MKKERINLKVHGFTMIELMIAVAIAAILLTIGVPSFQNMLADNRSTSEINRLRATIQFGRTEAIRLNQQVVLCPSTNSNLADVLATPIPACTGGNDFAQGWIMFVDNAGAANGIRNGGERLLKISAAMAQGTTFTGANAIIINARGFPNAANLQLTPSICNGNRRLNLALSTTGDISITPAACP